MEKTLEEDPEEDSEDEDTFGDPSSLGGGSRQVGKSRSDQVPKTGEISLIKQRRQTQTMMKQLSLNTFKRDPVGTSSTKSLLSQMSKGRGALD